MQNGLGVGGHGSSFIDGSKTAQLYSVRLRGHARRSAQAVAQPDAVFREMRRARWSPPGLKIESLWPHTGARAFCKPIHSSSGCRPILLRPSYFCLLLRAESTGGIEFRSSA
jgi:hypothetical protein